jgi:hypothetical protein
VNESTPLPPAADPTVLALARELAHAELRCAALARARRWRVVGVGIASAFAGFVAGSHATNPAMAQLAGSSGGAAPYAQSAPAPTREQLIGSLPPEERANLERFEQKIAWISQYMRASPQFDAGATIALFLGDMAKAMESVPKMESQMQAMNTKMSALPFMANEVAGMNAKMGVMAADMDSTMGRAGRMMPWGW